MSFGDLVHGVTDVDWAVGVRRAIVQDELVVTLVLLARQLIDLVIVPGLEALGLAGSEARPHREARTREVHRLLVLVCHLQKLLSRAFAHISQAPARVVRARKKRPPRPPGRSAWIRLAP